MQNELDKNKTVPHKSIYEFFKVTRVKIILTMILTIIFYIIFSVISSIFGINIECLRLPRILEANEPEPIPEPVIISEVIKYIPIAITGGYACDPPNSESYELAVKLVSISEILFIIFISYLASCTIVFFSAKLKKQNRKG